MVAPHQDYIIIGLGAHVHRGEIKAQTSMYVPNLKYVTFLTPSISPIYDNNPNFTLLELETSSMSIARILSWSFDLTAYNFY